MKSISKIHRRVNDAVGMAAGMKILDDTAELQDNNFWTEAAEAYHSIKENTKSSLHAILEGAMAMGDVVFPEGSNERVLHNGRRAQLTVLINTLNADTVAYFAQLDGIYTLHAGKTGATRGADDHMLLMGINGAYEKAVSAYHAKANPLTYEINVLSGVVAKAMEEQQAIDRDPTIITDMVAKEVPAETPEVKESDAEGSSFSADDAAVGEANQGV